MLRNPELKRLESDLPGFSFLHAFAAALPCYECEFEVRLMVRHDLSALQQYSLACIPKGVDSVDALDVVLGAGRTAITSALATLLGWDLIQPRDGGGLTRFQLTHAGVDALNEIGWKRPELTVVRVLFDALTGELVAPNRLLYINSGESAKLGLHVIPTRCQSPKLGDIEFGDMRRILRELRRNDQRKLPDGDLHDLIGVGSRRLVYRRCDIAAFQAANGTVVLRALDRGKRLRTYEDILNAMFPTNPEVLPFEHRDGGLPAELSPLIPRELLEKADELDEERERLNAMIEAEEREVAAELSEVTLAEVTSDSQQSVIPLSATRAELEVLKQRLAEVERERDSLRVVETHEHRELLEKALKHARKQVIIVSPWLEPAAINEELQRLMRRALERGVDIVIGWGMPPNSEERGARRDEKSLSMLRRLERMAREGKELAERQMKERDARGVRPRGSEAPMAPSLPLGDKSLGRLRVVRLGDTHEKILIADTHFAVVTSFNFLSYRADPKRGFRRETGIYYQVKSKIEELIQNVMQRIEEKERSVRPDDRDTIISV